MADNKLSARTSTTTTSGSYLYIIIPDGSGGWLSRKITHANLVAALSSSVSALQTAQAKTTIKTRHASKNANFTQILGSNIRLEEIDIIWVAGTPSVQVGTSLGANDVISGRTPTSGNNSIDTLTDYFESATTLYFTVSGGTVDIIVNHKENYNA